MRLFGRRLLSLLLLQNRLNGNSRRRGETLSETHMLGHEYGSRDGRPGRSPYRQRAGFPVLPAGRRGDGAARPTAASIEISDRVLLGLVDAYSSRLRLIEPESGPTPTGRRHCR